MIAQHEDRTQRADVYKHADLTGDHPWEGRKLQEGDTVWVGMTVASLPDLDSMIVEASLSDVDDGRIAPMDPAGQPPHRDPDDRHEQEPEVVEEEPEGLEGFGPG